MRFTKFILFYVVFIFKDLYAITDHELHLVLRLFFKNNNTQLYQEFNSSGFLMAPGLAITTGHSLYLSSFEKNKEGKDLENFPSNVFIIFKDKIFEARGYYLDPLYIENAEANEDCINNKHDKALIWFDMKKKCPHFNQSIQYFISENRSDPSIKMIAYKKINDNMNRYDLYGKTITLDKRFDANYFINYEYYTPEEIKDADGFSGSVVFQTFYEKDNKQGFQFLAIHSLGRRLNLKYTTTSKIWGCFTIIKQEEIHEGIGIKMIYEDFNQFLEIHTIIQKQKILKELSETNLFIKNPPIGDTYRPVILSLQADADLVYVTKFMRFLNVFLPKNIRPFIFDYIIGYDDSTSHMVHTFCENNQEKIIMVPTPQQEFSFQNNIKADLTIDGINFFENDILTNSIFSQNTSCFVISLGLGIDSKRINQQILNIVKKEDYFYKLIPCIPATDLLKSGDELTRITFDDYQFETFMDELKKQAQELAELLQKNYAHRPSTQGSLPRKDLFHKKETF